MPVTAGQTATFTVWTLDNDIAGRFRPSIEFYTDTYMSIKKEYSSTYTSDSADWVQMEYAMEAPADVAFVRAFVRMYDVSADWDGNAEIYIDDWDLAIQ